MEPILHLQPPLSAYPFLFSAVFQLYFLICVCCNNFYYLKFQFFRLKSYKKQSYRRYSLLGWTHPGF